MRNWALVRGWRCSTSRPKAVAAEMDPGMDCSYCYEAATVDGASLNLRVCRGQDDEANKAIIERYSSTLNTVE